METTDQKLYQERVAALSKEITEKEVERAYLKDQIKAAHHLKEGDPVTLHYSNRQQDAAYVNKVVVNNDGSISYKFNRRRGDGQMSKLGFYPSYSGFTVVKG